MTPANPLCKSCFILLVLVSALFSSCEYKYPDLTGERTTSLCVLGNVPFAGTVDGGMMKYSTEENRWIQVNNGLRDGKIQSLIASVNALFVGVDGGVYRSSDMAAHWDSLPVDVYYPSALLAHKNEVYVCSSGEGVWKSVDNGNTWSIINEQVSTDRAFSLAATDSGLYAGTASGIYFFRKNGYAWEADSGQFTGGIAAMIVIGNDIYAGDAEGKFYKSTNGNHHWSLISTICDRPVNHLYLFRNILFADTDCGTFTSADTGRLWSGLPAESYGTDNWNNGGFAAWGDSLLGATGNKGVFLSKDIGKTWTAFNNGMVTSPSIDWERSMRLHTWVIFVFLWMAFWILPARFLWNVGGGKKIYWINFISGIVLTGVALLIFSTRPSGQWDLGNAMRGAIICILYETWGLIFLIYALVKRYRGK